MVHYDDSVLTDTLSCIVKVGRVVYVVIPISSIRQYKSSLHGIQGCYSCLNNKFLLSIDMSSSKTDPHSLRFVYLSKQAFAS